MKKTLILMLAACLPLFSACDTARSQSTSDTLTWTHPTARVDGAAMPLSEIRETVIAWGPAGGPYTAGTVTVPAPATTVNVPRPATPGTRCYVAMTTDTGNRSSAFTNEVCKTILAGPRAPTNLQVQ